MKYWAYVNNEILGPFEKEKLLALPAFSPSLLICPQTPVGEKTEDWKEAATYPEISAGLSAGTLQSAPSADTQGSPAVAVGQPLQQQDHKALTPAPVDPFPPKESNLGGISLEVNHLERSGRSMPDPAPVAQSSSSFDPISLSSISRKADALSGTEAPARSAADSIAKEPHPAFSAPEPEPLQPLALEPQPQPLAQSFSQPQPAAAAAAAPGGPGTEELNRKLEALLQNAVSKQDVAALTEPLRMKIDQMGEVLSSMKNSQFQREIMDKLAYLENAVGEIKSDLKEKGPAPAPAQPAMVFERNSDTVFGAQPPAREEKSKPAPAAAAASKTTVIVDQGSRKFNFGAIFGSMGKMFFKIIMTVVLLTAVAFVAAIALKNAGVFDASRFIPFPVPFLTPSGGKTAPAGAPAPAEEKPAAQPQAQPQAEAAPAPAEKQAADASPEVIYFARYYTARAGGPKLEDKITEITAKAGGTYSPTYWQAKKYGPDMYEAAVVVPLNGGTITFAYNVDFAKKTIQPADPTGKAAFDALTKPAAAQKKTGQRAKRQNQKHGAAAQEPAGGQAAKAKPAGAKKAGKAEDEFEYVDEEEQ